MRPNWVLHSFAASSDLLPTHPLTHSFISHSLIHLFTHSFIHSFIHSSVIHSLTHSFIHQSFTHSFTHSFIHQSFTHSLTHLNNQPSHSTTQSTHVTPHSTVYPFYTHPDLNTELNAFTVEGIPTPYFRHLSVDRKNGRRLYVGGL